LKPSVRAAKAESSEAKARRGVSGRLARYLTDPVAFIDDCLPLNERGQPWRLQPHQRAVLEQAFAFDKVGRLAYDTIVYSAPKKSDKTTINAALTLW